MRYFGISWQFEVTPSIFFSFGLLIFSVPFSKNTLCIRLNSSFMGTVFGVLLLVLASASSILACFDEDNFSVLDYGATGDGYTDDSPAFLEAWDAACRATVESPRICVPPEGIFLVNPIIFQGPCNSARVDFMIVGTIIAPESPSLWDNRDASMWLGFKDVNGLSVGGLGMIDGRGKAWWDQSCRYHPKLRQCTIVAPTALKFLSCNESSISNMKLINSAQTHILVEGCNNFSIGNLVIQSPGNSPNTDGIHIQSSHDVVITNSQIGSGDDCISIGDHVSNIEMHSIVCGPGHGVSIGSLGKGGNIVQVEKIHLTKAFFNGTTNGARIKTWQVGRGHVRDVIFESLIFNYVKNPIIIDQNYCYTRNACKEEETGVQISNVIYKEVFGTSSTNIAINLNGSKSVPCFGISMDSIQLTSTIFGKQVTANCSNAYGQEVAVVPGPCLLQ